MARRKGSPLCQLHGESEEVPNVLNNQISRTQSGRTHFHHWGWCQTIHGGTIPTNHLLPASHLQHWWDVYISTWDLEEANIQTVSQRPKGDEEQLSKNVEGTSSLKDLLYMQKVFLLFFLFFSFFFFFFDIGALSRVVSRAYCQRVVSWVWPVILLPRQPLP